MNRAQEAGFAGSGVPQLDRNAGWTKSTRTDPENDTADHFDISYAAKAIQRGAILEALQAGPLSTLEARERLGILHCPGRVFELRKSGYMIVTRTSKQVDAAGRSHRVASYVLRGAE